MKFRRYIAFAVILFTIFLATPVSALNIKMGCMAPASSPWGIALNRLALTLTTVDGEVLDELTKLSEFALEIFENAMESVFDEDYSEADEVLEMELRTRELEAEVLHKILKQALPDEIPALRLIIESISRTAEYGADIAETVLNMTVKDAVIEA